MRYGDAEYAVDDVEWQYLQVATEGAIGRHQGIAFELDTADTCTALYFSPVVPLTFAYTTKVPPSVDPAKAQDVERTAAAGKPLVLWPNHDPCHKV